MKLSEVPLGYKFEHGLKGECIVIDKTPRTITIIHKFGKTKVLYTNGNATFYPSDF